jgi:Flp pilus assembly protein protease CpaA
LSDASQGLEAFRAVVLVSAFAYAAAKDLQTREVSDRLWQLLGVVGVAVGAVQLASNGLLPLLVWLGVGGFALEHLFPWDDALSGRRAGLVLPIELALYALAIVGVGILADRWGIGPAHVPVVAIGALVSIVLARVLFEVGVLYGGADAKALIVLGVLVPLFGAPLLYHPASSVSTLRLLPFSITVLVNSALLSVAAPIVIAIRNVARGEFTFPRGFTGYTLPVSELPRRFVWVQDPAMGQDTMADDAETAEEDARRRTEIARELGARGVRRVWVTPQLPFLVLMAAGAFSGLLVGNLLIDLFGVL